MPTDASQAQMQSFPTPFNASHEAAITAALKTIHDNHGLTMIAGPKGWGRGAVLAAVAAQAPEDVIVERMDGGPFDITALTKRLVAVLGVPVEETADDLRATGAALLDALAALAAEDRRLALVIDAGDGASARALLLLERMCRSDALCSVIGARGALRAALAGGKDARLKSMAQAAIEVRAFTSDEVGSLAVEEGVPAEDAAVLDLWDETQGAPEMVWERLPGVLALVSEALANANESEVANDEPSDPEPDFDAAESEPRAAAEQSDSIDQAAAELTASLEDAMAARNISAPVPAHGDDEDENGLWLEEDARPRRKNGLLLGSAAAALVAVGVLGVVETGVLETGVLEASSTPAPADMRLASGGLTFDMQPALPLAPEGAESAEPPVASVVAAAPAQIDAVAPASATDAIETELRTADAGRAEIEQIALAPRAAPRPGRDSDGSAAAVDRDLTGAELETSNALRAVAETALGAASAGAEALAANGVMSETLDGIAAGANERRVTLSRARQLDSLDEDAVEQRVRAALILADRRIAVKQFTEPSGVSAYDVLLNAWEVAPSDARLNKRFNRLVEIYRGEARRALSQERFGDFYRFNTVVDRILTRRPV